MTAITNRLNRNKLEKLENEGIDSLNKAFSRVDEQELLEDLLPNFTEPEFYSPIHTPLSQTIPHPERQSSFLSQFASGDLLRQTGVAFVPYVDLHVTTTQIQPQVRRINNENLVETYEIKNGFYGIINKIVEIVRDGSYN